MTQRADPAQDEDATRVVLFRTQAVGIVDRAANGETFLALKSAGMDGQQQDTKAAPPAEAQKVPEQMPALKMSTAMKASMTEALGAVLDTCAKMAEEIEKAEIDEAAPAPMPLLHMAMEAADKLDSMVDPYEDALMAPPPAEGEPAQKAYDAAKGEGMKPRPKMAMKRILAMEGVSKAMTDGAQKLGEMIAWAKGASGMPAPTMAGKGMDPATKADLDPYTALRATLQAVRDRMWAACEMLTKEPAKAIAELREVAGMLDRAAVLATGGTPTPADPAPSPPAPPAMTTEAVEVAVQKAFGAAKGDLLASLKGELGGLVLAAKGAAASAQAALSKVEKSVPAPNGQPAGENPTPPADAPPPADPWRDAQKEIQETSQARRRPAAGK